MKRTFTLCTPFVLVGCASLAGCLGAPNRESQERSQAAGGESREVRGSQLERIQHGNWHEAARGHGAVQGLPPDAPMHMEAESAPGGHFRDQTREQGPSAAPSSSPPPAASAAPSASPPPASSPPPTPRPRGRRHAP